MSKRFMKCYPILIETLSLNIGLNLSLFRMKNLITEIEHKLLKDLKGSSTDRTVKMLDKVGEKPNFLNPLVELLKEKSMGTVAHEVLKLMETPASDQEYEKSSHNATQLQAFNNCQGILVDALRPRILITVVPNARGKGLIDINEAESIKRRGETEEAVFMFLSMIKHKENFVERLYQVLEECDLKNIVTLVKQKMEKQIGSFP